MRYCFYILFSFFFLKGITLNSQLQVQFDGASTANVGQTLDVDVRVSDFNQLYSAQFAVVWDSLVLEVDSLFNVSTDLLDFNRSSLSLPSETVSGKKGRVSMSWFAGGEQTLPDDHRLFTMRFNVFGDECDETEFTIANPEGIFIEVIDSNFSDIGAEATPQPFMINGANCVVNPPVGDAIELFFDDSPVLVGTSVCIPLIVNNFDSVETFQASVMWDPTVLSFTGVQNFGLSSFTSANFNTGMSTDGVLGFVWFDNTGVTPATLSDGSTVFEACFDVIGSVGDNTILKLFDGTTTPTIQISKSGSGEAEFITTDANIVVVNEQREQFSLIAEDVVTSEPANGEVCVDFTTENFTDIAGMQFSMQWDPSILAYNRVETTDSEFASSFAPSGNDILRYVWTHTQGTGLSQADGTVIYSVCFDILQSCNNNGGQDFSTDISFIGETGRPIEITDNTFTALASSDVNLIDGSVTVTCGISCSETITDVRCFGESNGAINLNIIGGTPPYTVAWDNGGGTQNVVQSNTLLVGQSAGTYTATITDSGGTTITCPPYTINQPNELNLTVTVSGNAISTNVTGGNGGESISFVPNLNPPFTNIPDGTYTATATDSRGCMDSQTFTIGGPNCQVEISNITIFSTSCGNDGRIIITCAGGSGQYELLSVPPLTNLNQATGEATGVAAGTYQITCRDANDVTCFETQTITVLDGDPPTLNASVVTINNASCNQADGSIVTSISSGCPPYSITIQSTVSGGELPHTDLNGYAAGSYIVRFRDSGGNLIETPITIGSSTGAPVNITNVVVDSAPCTGMNGQATFTLTGGCGQTTCQVSISGGAPEDCNLSTNSNGTLSGSFPIGSHTITFTDDMSGTSDSETFNIAASANAVTATVMASDITPTSVNITVSGGTPGYSYQWFFMGSVISNQEDLTGLTQSGVYTVLVQDLNGCSTSLEVTVPPITGGGFSLTVNPPTNSGCASNNCDGVISGIISGGQAPYTLTLTNSAAESIELVFQTPGDFDFNMLCPESYDLSGVDALSGEVEITTPLVIMSEFEPLVIDADPNDLICPEDGRNNGSILATVEGGSGGYVLNWSPDELNDPFPTFMVENLSAGMYTLAVEDSNGCSAERTFDLLTSCIGADCFQGRRVITPNADGANDVLTINCSDNAAISIFDRFSRLIYNSNSYDNNWNGMDNDNNELPQGAYYWVVRTTTNTYKGTVTLLRD